jgi:hypothetical protein
MIAYYLSLGIQQKSLQKQLDTRAEPDYMRLHQGQTRDLRNVDIT